MAAAAAYIAAVARERVLFGLQLHGILVVRGGAGRRAKARRRCASRAWAASQSASETMRSAGFSIVTTSSGGRVRWALVPPRWTFWMRFLRTRPR